MGYDTDRFEDQEISEELICSICAGVLEDPLTTHCDHLFCSKCISDWLRNHHTCPIDRCPLRSCMLKQAPRAIRNLINRMKIHCLYDDSGCKKVLRLEQYHLHIRECDYNPESIIRCPMACQRTMTRRELAQHNCIEEMAEELSSLRCQLRERENYEQRLIRLFIIIICALIFLYVFLPFTSLIYHIDFLRSFFPTEHFTWILA